MRLSLIMTFPISLCPLFPSTLHVCHLTSEIGDGSDEELWISDNNQRGIYSSSNMPLDNSRLPLNPDHIATQMLEQPRVLDEPSEPARAVLVQPLRRTVRAARRPPSASFTSTPSPLRTPGPRRSAYRHGAMARPTIPDDTRRHGVVLEDSEDEEDLIISGPGTLPSYTPLPCMVSRRVTADNPRAIHTDPRMSHRDRQLRQLELRELQRQWNVRRRTHPIYLSERTQSLSLLSEAYDLPPPYAPHDPCLLFKPEERKPSIWSRVVLYPFVPEGELLNKAAIATDRLAKNVAISMKKGVEEAGKKARAVPKQIESKRARRKIKWLEGRGYVSSRTGMEEEEE